MSLNELVRKFVAEHVIGKERDFDVLSEPPLARYERFHELGISNWWLPKDLGGRGVSLRDSVDIVASLAYGDAGLAFAVMISILGTTFVDLYGTPEQRERYLRPLTRAPRYAALAASEHNAGSELLRMEVVAEPIEGGKYRLTGRKAFCTNADFADFVVVVAKVPGPPRSYRAFIVERSTPGFLVARRWPMIGLRASATYELDFNGCVLDSTMMLGDNGLRGLEVALNASRILIGAIGVGICERARDLALSYAQKKQVAGAPLLGNSAFSAKLGQMELEIEAVRTMCFTAAADFDDHAVKGKLHQGEALKSAMVAKMLSGQLTWGVVSTASQLFGGLGYTQELLVEKLVRDARIISIVEAGDDVLRDVLYQRFVLKNLIA